MEANRGGSGGWCILCCSSLPHDLKTGRNVSAAKTKIVDKFIRQSAPVSRETTVSAEALLGDAGERGLCGGCLSGAIQAAEKRGQVDQLEVQVISLQQILLRLLNELKELMDDYLKEMRGLEKKIRRSEKHECWRDNPRSRRGGRRKGDGISKDDVLALRQGIVNVVTELASFRKDPPMRLLSQEKPAPDLDELVAKVKREPDMGDDTSNGVTFDCDDDNLADSIPPSPVNESQGEVEEDDSADTDFTLPNQKITTSSRVTTFRARRTIRRRSDSGSSSKSDRSSRKGDNRQKYFNVPPMTKKKRHGVLGTRASVLKRRPSWYVTRFEQLPNGRVHRKFHYQCLLCPDFHQKIMFRFEQHLRAHEKELSITAPGDMPPLQCRFCPASHRFKQLHEYHELCHEGEFRLFCDICPNRKLLPVYQLQQHLEQEHGIEHTIQCPMCVQIHSDRIKYLKHLDHHAQRSDNPLATCDICDKTLQSKRELLKHYGTVHDVFTKLELEEDEFEGDQGDETDVEDLPNSEDHPPGYLPKEKRKRPSWYTYTRSKVKRYVTTNFYCVSCPNFKANTHYRLEQHLRQHERAVDANVPELPCPHCLAKYRTPQLLEFHVCQHQGLFQMICDQCRHPKLASSLAEHLQNDHGVEKLIYCGSCGMVNSSLENYLTHLTYIHKGPDAILACHLCPEKVQKRPDLIDHFNKEHGLNIKEEVKQSKVMRLSELQAQEEVMCPECGLQMKSRSLRYHIQYQHNQVERPFQCPKCEKRFKTRGNLTEHMQIHDRVAGVPNFQCHLCHKGFNYKQSWEAHIRMHEGTGFPCERCGGVYFSQKLLRNHLKTHEKPLFPCDQCNHQFPKEELLVGHKKIHEKGTDFQCDQCGKSYRWARKLEEHVRRVHHGERAFRCTFCPQSYNDDGGLRYHLRTKHPGEWHKMIRDGSLKTRERKRKSEDEEGNGETSKMDLEPETGVGASWMT